MNKTMKYILGFCAIFIAALLCVFGIVKYEESRDNTSTNNSTNLGGAEGQQVADKETTVVVEKLASLSDVDALQSELNLSNEVANLLKTYAPTVSYAVDNDKVYLRHGGYIQNDKIVGGDEIFGTYEVKDGKLVSSDEKVGDLSNLTWKNLNIKNSEHDLAAAKTIIDKYFFVTSGAQKLSGVGIFAYLSNSENRQNSNNPMIANLTVMPLAQVVDIYNTGLKDTYSEKDVRLAVASFKDMKYREIDDSYTGNEEKYKNSINLGELLFFTKDNMYVSAIGGIGGASISHPANQSSWTIDGDKVNIPIIGPDNLVTGNFVLRLNNKEYDGGQARSKYYIESAGK